MIGQKGGWQAVQETVPTIRNHMIHKCQSVELGQRHLWNSTQNKALRSFMPSACLTSSTRRKWEWMRASLHERPTRLSKEGISLTSGAKTSRISKYRTFNAQPQLATSALISATANSKTLSHGIFASPHFQLTIPSPLFLSLLISHVPAVSRWCGNELWHEAEMWMLLTDYLGLWRCYQIAANVGGKQTRQTFCQTRLRCEKQPFSALGAWPR